MLGQTFQHFFIIFSKDFRQGKTRAFEALMFLAVANAFGFYNPKQLADFLGVGHQKLYRKLKQWSIYHLKKNVAQVYGKPGG